MNRRAWHWCARITRPPSARAELCVWLALIVAVVAIRVYLAHLVPFAIWSRDAGSYAQSAARWLKSGDWETDPRRGPVYSLLIAACVKCLGHIDSVMAVQHVLGGIAVLLGIVVLRALWGRAALVPVALCGYAYAVYGLPVCMEHLVRNETLLFFFGTLAFAAWFFAIRRQTAWMLVLSGIAGALVMLTKSVYAPFPLLVIAGCLVAGRQKWKQAAMFAAGFALPYLGVRALNSATHSHRPPEPQSGILLYGRTAQFTQLDGGIEPDLKAAIRAEIEDYRRLPALNNNIILKRTVVPHLKVILQSRGETPADLNKLCRRLALEAIETHKPAYTKQVLRDCERLLFYTCAKLKSPNDDDLASLEKLLQRPEPEDSVIDAQSTLNQVQALKGRHLFAKYHRWIYSAWLFRFAPVLLTSLLLPWLVWRERGELRVWWFGGAGVWYFTIVLLCTVGRPMDRYVIPALPVMFWTLGSTIAVAWQWLARTSLARTENSLHFPAPL